MRACPGASARSAFGVGGQLRWSISLAHIWCGVHLAGTFSSKEQSRVHFLQLLFLSTIVSASRTIFPRLRYECGGARRGTRPRACALPAYGDAGARHAAPHAATSVAWECGSAPNAPTAARSWCHPCARQRTARAVLGLCAPALTGRAAPRAARRWPWWRACGLSIRARLGTRGSLTCCARTRTPSTRERAHFGRKPASTNRTV